VLQAGGGFIRANPREAGDSGATLRTAERIRLGASDAVLHAAERALLVITEQYFGPNLSLEEVRDKIREGRAVDPLRGFAEACRAELKGVRAAL
jgi:hypothetical protein